MIHDFFKDATSEGTQAQMWRQRPNGKMCLSTKPGKQKSTTDLQVKRKIIPHGRGFITATLHPRINDPHYRGFNPTTVGYSQHHMYFGRA